MDAERQRSNFLFQISYFQTLKYIPNQAIKQILDKMICRHARSPKT